jgi:hypothetical protein
VEGIVRRIRTFIGGLLLIVSAGAAAAQGREAQGRAAQPLQPSRPLFGRLFAANRECTGCENRPGAAHLVMDSSRLTDDWLARHEYQANGGMYGDNAAVADFWYDAVHRRLFTRSLVLHEVDDPADLRLGRAPGTYPDVPDFAAALAPGTTVGHVGFVRWSNNGFGSYFAAVQGAVRDVGTGYLDLSTVTSESGTTRTGSEYAPEDLIKHVRLHPSGQLEVGFETNPETRPDALLLVRGNAHIEGSLVVGGSPVGAAPPVLACGVRTATGSRRGASVTCDGDQLATGGGGRCASGEMRGSWPLQSEAAPAGWELACSKDGSHTVYVICCAR